MLEVFYLIGSENSFLSFFVCQKLLLKHLVKYKVDNIFRIYPRTLWIQTFPTFRRYNVGYSVRQINLTTLAEHLLLLKFQIA